MGYPQSYTGLEGYDSTKNYPFTLPFPTKITLLHIKKITLLHYLVCILLLHLFSPSIPSKCTQISRTSPISSERERERERESYDIIEWSMKKNHQAAMHPRVMQILPNIPYFIIHCSFTKTKIREKAHSHLVVL